MKILKTKLLAFFISGFFLFGLAGVSETATAEEHPFLLVTEDMYPELRARANNSPWKDMKATAISFVNNNSYNFSDNGIDKHYMIRNLTMHGALAYILDPANKISYKNKVRDALLKWDDAMTSVDTELVGWGSEVPPGSSFVSSVVAFDIIYNDLTPSERNAIMGKFNFVYNKIDRTSWPLNLYGVRGVWNIFNGDASQANIYINKYKDTINSQISTDGVGSPGSAYSIARFGGGFDRGASKTLSMDIFDFTGYKSFYDDPRMIKFYEWMIAGGMSPIKMNTVFGDSGLRDFSDNWATARVYSMNHFSSKAHGHVAWLLENTTRKFEFHQILFNYILQDQPMPTPEKPKSQIWTNGGAAFWEDNPSDHSLQGVIWNVIGITHAHSHRDVNSIHITAYGEYVLRNVGYAGYGNAIDSTFTWDWVNHQARANNVALINNDATGDKAGNGITEGFIGGLFDYASGDGGNCMPLSRGHHQRNFVMVHPQDGKPGYFVLIDEIKVNDKSHKGHILLHPFSASYTTVSANTEYKWTINEYSAHNVYLNIFLATPPSSVSLLNGGMSQPASVEKYIDSKYTSDSNGDISALTILFPSDSTHAKAAMSRIAGSGYTGAKIDHGSNIIDYAFESDDTSVITYNGASFQGLAALYRMNNNNNSFYFVRKGRSFDDGKVQRRGFESNADVTVYIKNKQGKIISSGADVTFYYPGITNVVIDGTSAPIINSGEGWVKVNVGIGNHDVLLLTDETITCQLLGYQCCDSCQSGPHSEYDGDCSGQVCCEICSLSPCPGDCCSAAQICQGGSSVASSDCGNVCCVGGTCEDVASTNTCQNQGYQCCASCQSGSHPEYNGNCPGQVCCEVCSLPPETCASESGTCCAPLQICQGGLSASLSGCSNICCIGGTCAYSASPTCQSKGYQCCVSCQSGPHLEYSSDCSGEEKCCEVCYVKPPSSLIDLDIKNPVKASSFAELIENTIIWTLSIVGSLALLILIFGGVMYIGSSGDEQKVLTAKKIVTYAIIGLILILLSYAIVIVLEGILI